MTASRSAFCSDGQPGPAICRLQIAHRNIFGVLDHAGRDDIEQRLEIEVNQAVETDDFLLIREEQRDDDSYQPSKAKNQSASSFTSPWGS